jgi:hypothetical protein
MQGRLEIPDTLEGKSKPLRSKPDGQKQTAQKQTRWAKPPRSKLGPSTTLARQLGEALGGEAALAPVSFYFDTDGSHPVLGVSLTQRHLRLSLSLRVQTGHEA